MPFHKETIRTDRFTKKEGNLLSEDKLDSASNQGRDDHFMDIDRMVNEGLGGGNVSMHNGLIEETTTDTMSHKESVIDTE
jgi:hypothetical protein